MSRSSSEIKRSINSLESKLETQNSRLTTVKNVKYFLNTAYVGQVNAINTEIGYLYDNLLDGILNGIGATNTLNSKHNLVNDYVQKQSGEDSYLSDAISDLSQEETITQANITSLQTSISNEWTEYYDALEREEEERRRANNLQLG